MNNNAPYLNFVQDILTNQWEGHESLMTTEDSDVGMQLFTQLALKTANDLSATQSDTVSALSKDRVKVGEEDVSETTSKVERFVKKHSCRFREICKSGFPFSMLERPACEKALKGALEDDNSIIATFMTQNESVWLSEEELNESFGKAFKRLDIIEISEACSDLTTDYIKESNNKAGYYLLWLIKQSTGANFNIPAKETFNKSTVQEVLSQFAFSGIGQLESPTNFIEILYFRRFNNFLYKTLSQTDSHLQFLNFILSQLQNIPMDKWPGKGYIIADLLRRETPQNKITISERLNANSDSQIATIGKHLLQALQSTSLRLAIPHIHTLIKLLPNLSDSDIEHIFYIPLNTFCKDKKIFNKDPEFTRRLTFNSMRTVFVHGDLMAGVYHPSDNRLPPYLLAYNMKTEKMEWGIPLIPGFALNTSQAPMISEPSRIASESYCLNRVDDYITLQFIGEENIYLIDPNTGDISSTLALPYAHKDKRDRLHLTSSGFSYQMIKKEGDRKLIGYKISASNPSPLFEVETSDAFFLPLSTHVGLFKDTERELDLYSPTGNHVTLDCISAYAQGNKLYLIEPNPSQKNTSSLTVRTMTNDEKVVSSIEKSIPLNTEKVSLKQLCDNGQLILFKENFLSKSPIFVDLHNNEAVYSEHQIHAYEKEVVNTVSGEVWCWNQSSEEICKISAKQRTLMGSLNSGRGTTLLHVDQRENLYFVDIAY